MDINSLINTKLSELLEINKYIENKVGTIITEYTSLPVIDLDNFIKDLKQIKDINDRKIEGIISDINIVKAERQRLQDDINRRKILQEQFEADKRLENSEDKNKTKKDIEVKEEPKSKPTYDTIDFDDDDDL